MAPHWISRTELLIGEENLNKLKNSHVLVVGLGGIGGAAAEFLCRAGIGELTIVDGDTIEASNRNRQLVALISNENQYKVDIMGERLRDINPDLKLHIIKEFLEPERTAEIVNNKFTAIVDCIDSIAPKVELILSARKHKVFIISSMGAGGKTDPSAIKIADISKTTNCNFASEIKKKLKKRGVTKGVKAVYSEQSISKSSLKHTDSNKYKKSFYGTISYIPNIFGIYCAHAVINRICNKKPNTKPNLPFNQ